MTKSLCSLCATSTTARKDGIHICGTCFPQNKPVDHEALGMRPHQSFYQKECEP